MFERLVGFRYLRDNRRSYALLLFLILGLNLLVHGLGVTFFLLDSSSTVGFLGLILLILGAVVTYVCGLALFLSVYTVISVVGVTVGVAALTTVLSVMSGFEQDLQQKILGANAHIVVRKEGGGDLYNWPELVKAVKSSQEVEGASPFIDDEVIATSPTGLAGVLLKGIDPSTIGEVSKLPQNIPDDQGGLEYLVDPARILKDYPIPRMGPPVPEDQDYEDFEIIPVTPPLDLDALELDDDPPAAPLREEPSSLPSSDVIPVPPLVVPTRPRLGDPSGLGDPFLGPFGLDEEPWRNPSLRPDPLRSDYQPFEEVEVSGPPPALPPKKEQRVLPGVILGKQLAEETLHVRVGDEINLVTPWGDLGPTGPIPKSRAFRVAGIFYSGMYEFDARYVYLTLPEAQKFLLLDDTVTGIEVRVKQLEKAGSIAEEIGKRIQGYEGGPYVATPWQELNKSLFSALKVEKRMMFLVLVVIILVAAFFIVASLLMVVLQKTREIAILKSMGATGPMVMRIFFVAGSFIGLMGTTFGVLGGYGLCRLIEWRGVPIPADVYYISRLPVVIHPVEFILVGASALFISLIAALYPSYLASRLTPVEGLRL